MPYISPYKNTVIFDNDALDKLVELVKTYPIAGSGTGITLVPYRSNGLDSLQIQNAIDITAENPSTLGSAPVVSGAYLKVTDKSVHSDDTTHNRIKYFQVGDNLTFSESSLTNENIGDKNGTFKIDKNSGTPSASSFYVKIKGFDDNGNYTGGLKLPDGNKITILDDTEASRVIAGNTDPSTGVYDGTAVLDGSITTMGGIAAKLSIKGYKLYGAIFNDYAEYRKTEDVEAGKCVVENGDGSLKKSTKRLQPGANIVSDTFGFSIGQSDVAQTPIAVCGRVLAFPAEPKAVYEPGDAVCSGPNGTVSKMTREEIREWPDRIVGFVSEIPTYDRWGSDNIEVKNRIWIKVR